MVPKLRFAFHGADDTTLGTGRPAAYHLGPMDKRRPSLAYRDPPFLDSEAARPVRILAEYLAPLDAFRREGVTDTIVFFGSARITPDGAMGRYYEAARELARLVTEWSQSLDSPGHRYIVCTGGGPGIMEAANRGACEEKGRSIGLNIGLPHEQRPNPYISRRLSFQFHYFFMRKLWFAHLARAMVVFPGGFGTLDETFEMLTLSQTRKLERSVPVLLYGSSYWKDLIDFEAMARNGMIDRADLDLFGFVDDPREALRILQERLGSQKKPPAPEFASSTTPQSPAPAPPHGPR